MTNAITRYAEIGGNQIAYRTFGNGSPIILANRFRGTLDTWDPLFLEQLAEKNTIIQFDYPGIGFSEGELPTDIKEVASYVDKVAGFLSIDKYAVLGWSYGGLVAQYAAFMQPEEVIAAIIIGSNPMGRNEVPIKQLFREKAFIPDYTLEDEIVLFFEPKSEKSRAAAKASHDRIEQQMDRSKVPADPAVFMRYFAAGEQVAVDADHYREAYQTTHIPFLALSGDNDISFAAENWFPMLQNAPTLQQIIFPNTGHAPHFQYADLSVSYINSFLQFTTQS
jgi:pimeloyl-ACP methyl ester carboxylesterase